MKQRFEHTYTRFWEEVIKLQNIGWEVITVSYENDQCYYYLKRPYVEQDAQNDSNDNEI